MSAHVIYDFNLKTKLLTQLLQGVPVARIAGPKAHIRAHHHQAGLKQIHQPGAHKILSALGGKLQGVVNHQGGIHPLLPQRLKTVSQRRDQVQVGVRIMHQARMRIKSQHHARHAHLLSAPHSMSQNRLMTTMDAVENTDSEHAASS